MSVIRACCWCCRGLLVLAWATLVSAHPNHDAIAEADWNAETGSLEVALQVNAHELERAVSQAAGEALDLDAPASLAHLKRYVAGHFRCLKADGSEVAMVWVGAEIKVRSAWLYLEFPLGRDAGDAITGCSLSSTVFFELFEDQKNTVAIRVLPEEPRRFLRFSKGHSLVPVAAAGREEAAGIPGAPQDDGAGQ